MKTEYYEPENYDDLLIKIDHIVAEQKLDKLRAQVEFSDSSLDVIDQQRLSKAFKEPKLWRSIRNLLNRYKISNFELYYQGKAKIIHKYGDELIINIF